MFRFENENFIVYETSCDFQITSKVTGKTCGMGDMVDSIFNDAGDSIPVGTIRFYQALHYDLEYNASTYMEAYFPEEMELA